jgi:hypothetical protein
MNEYKIRYNQTRGEPNRGTVDHVWRVFENDKEYLVKNIKINVPCFGAQTGMDYSICCSGIMSVDRATSTITINNE